MKHTLIRGALFAALAFGGNVFASDIVDVRIGANGNEHQLEVDLDTLQVGASRQLATKAGLPAIVSRTDKGLDIEIAGKTTNVKLRAIGDMVFVNKADGDAKIRVIELDGEALKEIDHDGGNRKIVVMRRHGDADGHAPLDDARLAELLAEVEAKTGVSLGDGAGERVIVTRKVLRDAEPAR